MKKNLLKETTGVPRPILFWVEHFSENITNLIEELINDDDFTEFAISYTLKNGEKIEDVAYGSGYEISSNFINKKILDKLGYSNIEDFIQDPKFKQFPLFYYNITLDVILLPDDFYDIEFKDQPYDSLEGSHGLSVGDKLIGEIFGTNIIINQDFMFKIYLPLSVKNNFNKNQIKSYLKPTVNHELLHAYETYLRYMKNEDPFLGRESFLNMALSKNRDVISPNIKKMLQEFFHLVYLHLYFEINARISQLYQEMVENNVSTKEEFLKVLYGSKPWNDAKMLTDFNAKNFLSTLDSEKTKEFIEEWDSALQFLNTIMRFQGVYKGKYMENVPTEAKKDPYIFFKFFENRFHKKGEIFKRKAYRLYDIVTNPSVMTENLQQKINCTACGHSWEVESGDDNPYLCHMCGYDVSEKKYNKEELNDFWANKLVEKWSKKYKKSINCNNPKGFSQKAHCAARRKR